MTLLDWIIVIIPIGIVMYAGWNIRKYITGVADFMVGGRICRRYVITTGNMANALGLIRTICSPSSPSFIARAS